MITIKTIEGKELNLQVDLRIAIEETSIFEGKQGAYSLPLELPYTSNNAEILGMPSNIERVGRFTTNVDVVISSGPWIRHANLEINESVYKDYIQCTLYLKESPFFRKLKDLKLIDVFKNKIVDLNPDSDLESKLIDLISHCNRVLAGVDIADYFFFPVCIDVEDKEEPTPKDPGVKPKKWQSFTILNQQNTPGVSVKGELTTSGNVKHYSLLTTRYAEDENGKSYELPKGYGITPFLKFSYVIKSIFQHLGYNLNESIFDTDLSFKRMCLLNNTIDSIVKGVIDYSQLVPDISIVEFLEFVENSFGCEFLINEFEKTVTPKFWNDLLSDQPYSSLSNSFEDFPKITMKDPESIKITVGRENKETTPLKFETYQELFDKYGQAIYIKTFNDASTYLWENNINTGDHLFHVGNESCFVLLTNGRNGKRYLIEKDTLDFYEISEDYILKEKKTGFESLQMMAVPTMGMSVPAYNKDTSIVGGKEDYDGNIEYTHYYYTYYNTDFFFDLMTSIMPRIENYRHLNTVYQKKVSNDKGELVTDEKEAKVDLPIIPCFYYGLGQKDSNMKYLEYTAFGTNSRYSNIGSIWGSFDLTTKSLFDKFWKKYDQVIRTSFHSISGTAQLSTTDIMNLRFDKQYLLKNQHVLPVAIQYEVTNESIEVTNLTVKITKVYE